MSYFRKIEYEMIPKDSFSVIRGCARCGRKTHFTNTEKFRVNANGNKLDVWLIYQCEECKHTLNLAICERQKVSSIPKGEYQRFLDNDEELARRYGTDLQLFQKNKAEIDFEKVSVDFVKKYDAEENGGCGSLEKDIIITIHNPYKLKLRSEKQIAMVLEMSRSQVKSMMEQGELELETQLPQQISFRIKGVNVIRKEIAGSGS